MSHRVHVAFEEQARSTPDRVAVIAGQVRTSYAQLDAWANRIARRLRRAGAGPGTLVGVCLGRDEHLVPALLGVLKTGAAYVPMDPAYPAERLAYIAADAATALTAVTGHTARAVTGPAVRVDEPDDDATPLDTPGGGRDAAYVIYTSGSTGRPKGVVVEHRNTMNLLRWEARAYTAEELGGMLATASISFDPSVSQLFLPLVTGGTVILAENLLALPTLPARDEVRTVYGVPSALAALLREPLPAGVRAVFAGGEPLTRALVERIYANPGVRRVLNLYGPTECTTTCAVAEIGRDDDGEPPIGRPAAGAVMTVRDAAGVPVADGELGELWIGGPVVARGYLGQASPAFTTDEDGGRVYRSGDLVRRRAGVLHFAGRGDDQVKIRGYRVEPGEVEAVLVRHPDVRRACVLPARDPDGVAYLAGHVEASGPDERALRAWLRRRVPEHLVPTRLAVVDRLPLSPNGKVDRAALPQLPARRETATGYVAPRTPVEADLAGIVGGVLGIAEVGVHDRFPDLGGHSLAAARVCALAGRGHGTTVALADFLAEPTVAALAALVQRRGEGGEGGTAGATPVRHEGRTEYPLTPTQRELWTLRQVSPVPAVTTVAFRVRLTGPVDPGDLRRALAAVVARHEVLRSRIVERDGEPVAVVGAGTDVPVTEHDLRDLPAADRDARAGALAAAAARHAFDLAAAVPLLRADVVRHPGDVSDLVLVADHVAFDGWSTGALLTELAEELTAPGSVAPPPLQVGDLALAPAPPAGQAWRAELDGASPPDGLFTGAGGFRGERLTRPVPPALGTALAAACAAGGAAPFAGWLTALGLVLAGYTCRDDVLVGTVVARRAGPELDRVIGPLVDVLPVRLRLDAAATVRDTIAAAAAATARALDRPRPSTADLFDAVGTQPRGAMPTPVVLSAQPPDLPVTVRRGPLRLDLLGELSCGGAQNPLTVFVNETAAGTELQLEYDLDLTDRAWAAAFADRLLHVLAGVAAGPDRPLSAVPLVTAAEEARLLRLAAGPPLPAGAPATVVEAVERQVRQRPGDTAVAGADGRLTYRQLWDASAEVAAVLVDRGTRRGEVVGVCLPRDHRLPATLLGVWRAGAAYLPLEPDQPAERLGWLAADGGVRTVLCRTGTAAAAAAVAGTHAVDLDRAPAADRAPALPPAAPRDLAYLLYTSGSTGTPKGVAVAQAGLAALTEALRLEPGLAPGDRMLAVATLSFDTSCAEIWTSLAAGACCVVVGRDSAVDGFRLAERIAAHRITAMNVPPTMLRTLLASGWTGTPHLRVWPGGEALDAALARDLLPRVEQLWNVYGPTEATVLSSAYQVTDADDLDGTVPIGHPLPGERLYVMDPLGRLAPPDVTGELWIGGAGPALGYHRRAELTAAAFVPDPAVPGGRCYRTGDLVRRRPDGELLFRGRRDHQLKIRGYRVELGEIEAALREHPGVTHAVVTARGHGAEAHLVGYLAGTATGTAAAEYLRGRLPEYLVPHRWVVLDALPTLPSGKVDLAALPEPGQGDGTGGPGTPHRPVASVMEELVADVWGQVLATDAIGAGDSFFGLGGHSLAATRVAGRLRDTLGCPVPVRLLFDHPVLADFAERLERLVMDDIVATPGHNHPGI
ncbi:amino acid adenylation domain-containing protein [Dactylosporangium aurantiacum]|uniref:Amino acid adenylation domain-containing protein n=1 Tax=Dactylosporangium aurantiacum TaxID=35754 RepID=A0A9Q9MJY3_9ACTN|nr:non-ribosomal peptide synthetase [Dactylosporangium aurantiacum]MDG6101869.1 amino acid adenylation domain-containing protein [Dactylosporangium aurantiacum]UWZ52332.1 amino acid adenylation domain-containing protein [Dactylosporangium aurantiacum]